MSYLVLARKWRPQFFADVVGQEAVVRILQNALRRQRVAHAMIFSGVRGVGKTTLARIMAKALNCEEQGEEPCNQCRSCQEMTAGSAVDLKEIDGASNRGIQEIRELKENIRFFPVVSRYKIVIIDEVHMLTTEAFNALLKTLEEPPEHVYFMFATTELHKVPITILSRCQRYELKRVGLGQLRDFFAQIAASEEITISASALDIIAREADGSVRDGLSLLDQMFSFAAQAEDGRVTVQDDDVVQVLGLVVSTVFVSLAQAVVSGDMARCLELLQQIYLQGVDVQRFGADLLAFFRGMMICKTTANPQGLLDVSDEELQTMQAMAQAKSKETLYQLFHVFLQGLDELRFARQPRLTLEMLCVRAMQVGEVTPAAELAERLGRLIEKSGGIIAAPPPQQEAAAPPVAPPQPTQSPPPAAAPVSSSSASLAAPAKSPAPQSAPTIISPTPPETLSPPASRHQTTSVMSTTKRDVVKDWQDFIGYVKERQAWMAQSLRLCENPHVEDDRLVIRFDNPADCTVISQPEKLKALTTYAQDFFQTEFSIDICAHDFHQHEGDGPSPRDERRALATEPLVEMVTEVFDGQVAGIRTGPKFR